MEIQAYFERLVDHLTAHDFFLEEAVEILERTLIAKTLNKTGGNRTETARLLGIHRNTLQKKMAQYSIKALDYRRKPVGRAGSKKRKSDIA